MLCLQSSLILAHWYKLLSIQNYLPEQKNEPTNVSSTFRFCILLTTGQIEWIMRVLSSARVQLGNVYQRFGHSLGHTAHCSTNAQVLTHNCKMDFFRPNVECPHTNRAIFRSFWIGDEMAKTNNFGHSTDWCTSYWKLFWCRSTMGSATGEWRKCRIFHCRFTFHDNALCEYTEIDDFSSLMKENSIDFFLTCST